MPALQKKVSGSEYIEVKIDVAKTRYYFDYYPILEDKKILYIQNTLAGGKSLSNRDVLNATALSDAYLVLVNNGEELINRLPLKSLRQNTTLFPLFEKVIDWQKSYIEFSTVDNLVLGESIVLAAYLEDPEYISRLSNDILKNIELVDLPIRDVNQTRFYFREVLKLKDKRIRLIDFLSGLASPNSYTAIAENVYNKAYLTLRTSKGREIISKLLLGNLTYFDSSGPNYMEWQDWIVDFDKSYIEVPNTDNLVLNSAFVFNFHYLDNVSTKRRAKEMKNMS